MRRKQLKEKDMFLLSIVGGGLAVEGYLPRYLPLDGGLERYGGLNLDFGSDLGFIYMLRYPLLLYLPFFGLEDGIWGLVYREGNLGVVGVGVGNIGALMFEC
jgi:hypothetical protein